MDFLSWYDWITPTNPIASIFFGVLFTFIVGITVWVDTKQSRTVIVTAITGIAVTGIGVIILNAIGFYA
ncbi:hypothetical protein [Mesobacillus foraminis]|uniref:hypothetical protein n=1 Tax=Mesobacillus foraminis TaxID=279826 RepID=UPI000EF48072|nr:hypothetical protein [Mesobacillus foraminis]